MLKNHDKHLGYRNIEGQVAEVQGQGIEVPVEVEPADQREIVCC